MELGVQMKLAWATPGKVLGVHVRLDIDLAETKHLYPGRGGFWAATIKRVSAE